MYIIIIIIKFHLSLRCKHRKWLTWLISNRMPCLFRPLLSLVGSSREGGACQTQQLVAEVEQPAVSRHTNVISTWNTCSLTSSSISVQVCERFQLLPMFLPPRASGIFTVIWRIGVTEQLALANGANRQLSTEATEVCLFVYFIDTFPSINDVENKTASKQSQGQTHVINTSDRLISAF